MFNIFSKDELRKYLKMDRILFILAVFLGFVIFSTRLLGLLKIIDLSGGQEITFADFKSYYAAMEYLLEGKNVYDTTQYSLPYLYPPFFLILLYPFTLLPLNTAIAVFTGVNFLLLIILFLQMRREAFGDQAIMSFLILLCIFFSIPCQQTLVWGQINIIIAIILFNVYVNATRDKRLGAAFWANLGGFIKLVPFSSLIFLLKQKSRLRFLIFYTAAFIIFLTASFLIFGIKMHIDFIDAYLGFSSAARSSYNNASPTKIFVHLNVPVMIFYLFAAAFFCFLFINLKDKVHLFLAVIVFPMMFTSTIWEHHFMMFYPFLILLLFDKRAYNRWLAAGIILVLNTQSYAIFVLKRGILVDPITLIPPIMVAFVMVLVLLGINGAKEFRTNVKKGRFTAEGLKKEFDMILRDAGLKKSVEQETENN